MSERTPRARAEGHGSERSPRPESPPRVRTRGGFSVLWEVVRAAWCACRAGNSHFGIFLRSLSRAPRMFSERLPRPAGRDSSNLPCPPPLFNLGLALACAAKRKSGRRARVFRSGSSGLEACLTGLIVTALSWEHLGRPKEAPPEVCFGAPVSSLQQAGVRGVRRRVGVLLRRASGWDSHSSGGKKGPVVQELLATLLTTGGAAVGTYGAVAVPSTSRSPGTKGGTHALRVDPERIALPATTGKFVAEDYMPPGIRQVFLDPRLVENPPHPPTARTRCGRADLLRLLARMDAAGMLDFCREDEVDGKLAAGLFSIFKDTWADRLITNRRPRNSQEMPLGASRVLFPQASQLGDVVLKRGQRLRGSGDDLPDFYHTIRVSDSRALSNTFGPVLAWDDIAHLEAATRLHARVLRGDTRPCAGPPRWVRAMQRTLPMGDRNATDFAQIAHLGVLARHGGASMDELVSYRSPLPGNDTLELVMVDDHIVVQVVGPRPEPGAREPRYRDVDLVEASELAYADAGLTPKPAKRFRYAERFSALGADVDGSDEFGGGWVSAAFPHIGWALSLTTAILRSRSLIDLKALEVAMGFWTQVLCFQRLGFAVPDAVYRLIAGARSTAKVTLGAAARDELLVLSILSPLWSTDLRAPVRDELFATDASGGAGAGLGVCRAPLSSACAEELWRRRTRRGGYSGCLPQTEQTMRAILLRGCDFNDVDELDHVGDKTLERELRTRVGELCEALTWKVLAQLDAKSAKHINVHELSAVRTLVRRLIARGVRRERILVAIDSSVVDAVIAKGRSASRELLWGLRAMMGDLLFAELSLGSLPVGSAFNPADAPSRRRRLRRGPVPQPAPWADRFAAGDSRAFPRRHDPRAGLISARDSGLGTSSRACSAGDGPRDKKYAPIPDIDLRERPSLRADTKENRARSLS